MNLSSSTNPNAPAGVATDFAKMRVGVKLLDDATIQLGDFRRISPQMGDKKFIQIGRASCRERVC